MKKVFKIVFKILMSLLIIIVIAGVVLKLTFNEDIPTGTPGKPADDLALKMLAAIQHEKFLDAQRIQWTFLDKNHYVWLPQQDKVNVSWDKYKVELRTNNYEKSTAYKNNILLNGSQKDEAITYAIKNFNNDSFWVVAPFKIMDPGTEREIIKEDAQEKLLVRYTTGGTTPGDVYIWKLDKNYKPQNFKMWVDILPLDGIEARWEQWEMTDAGFPLPMKKSFYSIEIPVTEISVE